MLYAKQITVSKNTSSSAPEETQFKISKGVLYRIYLGFPAGCAGLVKFRMILDGHPILPVNADAYIRGDAITYEYPIFEEITEEPMTITAQAWNEDDTYDHTIDLQILVVSREWIVPQAAIEGVISSLRSLFVRS